MWYDLGELKKHASAVLAGACCLGAASLEPSAAYARSASSIGRHGMDKHYKVREVAQRLAITPYTVRAYIKEGRLPARRLGGRGHWYVREADLLRLLEGK